MNSFKAALVGLLLHVFARFPLPLARALGRAAARIYWPLNRSGRRVTERNLQLALPELDADARRRLARDSILATGELAGEMGRIWLRPWSQVRGLIRSVEGVEPIAAALREGRAVLVLVPHLGNWEVLGLHLPTLGPTVSLYEPPQLAGLGPLIRRARERSGASLVPTDNRGLARLLRNLERGGIAGILPDQVPRDVRAGRNAPFMGVPCFTATLAGKLIRRTGALAVFGVATRSAEGFHIRYRCAGEAVYAADELVALAALNRGIEACVRECPTQYQWSYKRFKVRPRRGPGVYQDL